MRARLKPVRSRDNPQVKALIKLAGSARERSRTATTVLEGEHLVRAYAASGGVAEAIVVAESALGRPGIRELAEHVPAQSRLLLPDRLMEQISQLVSAAGLAAVARTPDPGPLPQTLPSCVVLENMQDPGNAGSILRSAVAAGIRHVFFSRDSVFAWSPKVVRAAMGAHFRLSIFEDAEPAAVLKDFPGRIVATDPRGEASLYDLDLRGPVAWLFGNEGGGLTAQARSAATDCVRIPMPGPAESLNLAAAVAVCLFEQVRQRR